MPVAPPRPKDLPLSALRAFEAAARLGGFASAAQGLGGPSAAGPPPLARACGRGAVARVAGLAVAGGELPGHATNRLPCAAPC